jgi:adenylyltransferase/sulfurtransferase
VTKLIDYDQFCGIVPQAAPAQIQNGISQISPIELKRRLDAGEDLFVLDVREPHEYQIANLGAKLIPLGDLPARVNELNSSREIVVHCKSGGRSQKAAEFLAQSGFKKLHNLAGGINAWSTEVDPKVAKY